jgi:hypothetical protein
MKGHSRVTNYKSGRTIFKQPPARRAGVAREKAAEAFSLAVN